MNAQEIPGMIETVEQDLLTELAGYASLGKDGVVCEFGAYFGRSTMCLAEGLLRNPALDLAARTSSVLRTYDAFSCHRSGMLGRYVMMDAKRAGQHHLLRSTGEKLDFLPLFDHFLSGLPQGLLSRYPVDLSQARHSGEPIVLMHVDAPKWYEEYIQVLRAFGPSLVVGARVVLQDFFYHWSASVIGAVEVMLREQLIEPMESAASSLLVKVSKPLDPATIETLHCSYQKQDLDTLIEGAVARFDGFELDRRTLFLPRLMLAGMQSAFERGDFQLSGSWLKRAATFCEGQPGPLVLPDLCDLVGHGLSMRKFYQLDLAAAADLGESLT